METIQIPKKLKISFPYRFESDIEVKDEEGNSIDILHRDNSLCNEVERFLKKLGCEVEVE